MTKVLVAYATKMGATREIADAIGDELQRAGMQVTVAGADDVDSLDGYDAAVVGSAVYLARWRPEALKVLSRQAKHGSKMPIWLYQSGPFDHHIDQSVAEMPRNVRNLAATLRAAPPITFGGRLEPATAQGFIAKKMAKGSDAGDYRDFTEIRRWADQIAAELAEATA